MTVANPARQQSFLTRARYFSPSRFACEIASRSHTRLLRHRDQKRPDYTGCRRNFLFPTSGRTIGSGPARYPQRFLALTRN